MERVAVNLATESAAVEGHALDPQALARAVDAAGYAVPTQTIRLDIEGMTCATCVARLENGAAPVAGVTKVGVNLASDSASVEIVSGAATARDLDRGSGRGRLLCDRCPPAVAPPHRSTARADFGVTRCLRSHLALPLLVGSHLTLVGIEWAMPAWMQWLLATPVQFWCARRFYFAAAKAVRAGTGNMDLLVSLGTLAAYGLSLYLWLDGGVTHETHGTSHLYFEAAAVVIALVLLGKWLEARAKHQTSEAIRLLAALRPTTANVLRDQHDRRGAGRGPATR